MNGTDKKWLGSIKAKVIAVTAILAALTGLTNGAIDLYKGILKIPTSVSDKTNDALFKKNFAKQPLVSQPLTIKSSGVEVTMLLQVFDEGDVFVRYGEFQQWLPFRPIKVTRGVLVTEALAQSSLPRTPSSSSGSIIIDLDKLKREQREQPSAGTPDTIEKSYTVAELKDDHPNVFTASRRRYTNTYAAEAGYKIIKSEFELARSQNSRVLGIKREDDGSAVRIEYELRSGPVLDRWRGWLGGTLKTVQQRTSQR